MRTLKQYVSLAIVAVLMLTIIPVISRAASFSVTLSVDTFTQAGYTDATVTVVNDSQKQMTNIEFECLGRIYSFQSAVIQAGAQQYFNLPDIQITEAQIGQNFVVTLKWYEDGQMLTATQNVMIKDGRLPEPTPEIDAVEFTCSADNPRVESGEKVKLRYKIQNNSTEAINDVTVTDSNLSEAPLLTGKTIGAGDSYSFSFEYTMGDNDVVTSPILSWSMSSGIKTKTGDSIGLESVTVDMEVNVSRKDPTNDGTEFTVDISNNGNKSITNIRIYKNNEKVEHSFDLGIGESRQLSYMVSPETKEEVTFVIEGRLATGEEYKYESETYIVWKYIDPSTLGIDFSAKVSKALDKDGYVTIDLTAKNTGTVDMTGLTVTESAMEQVGKFSDLVGGGEETLSLTLYIGEARDMHFTLQANAPTGEPYEYNVDISAQAISTGEEQPIAGIDVSSIDVGGALTGLLKTIFTVLAVVTLVSGVGLIVLAIFERQRNIQLKKEDQ